MSAEFTTAYTCLPSFLSLSLSLSSSARKFELTCVAPPLLSTVIQGIKADKGLALQDLVQGAYEFVQSLEMGDAARVYLLDQLASTE